MDEAHPLTHDDVFFFNSIPGNIVPKAYKIIDFLLKIGRKFNSNPDEIFKKFQSLSREFKNLVPKCRPLLNTLCLQINTKTNISTDSFYALKHCAEYIDDFFDTLTRNEESLTILSEMCSLCNDSLKRVFSMFTFTSVPNTEKDPVTALINYEKIAEHVLKDGNTRDKILSIKKLIQKRGNVIISRFVRNPDNFTDSPAPFTAIIGPSLMGKSQLAITLSKIIPLIYLNFEASKGETQALYKCFESISAAVKSCIDNDLKMEDFKKMENSAAFLDESNIKSIELETVGLLYSLMELGLDYDFESNDSWIKFYTKVSFVYQKMSIAQFIFNFAELIKNKVSALHGSMQLEDILDKINVPVIFIDEFGNQEQIVFLRDLCRVLRVSCILASTNARVSNMIQNSSKTSSSVRDPWCEIIANLPSASFEGITNVTKISDHSLEKERLLSEFILPDGSVKVEELCEWMTNKRDALTDEQMKTVNEIVKLVKTQSTTCLQGVACIAIEKLFKVVLPEIFNGESFGIFDELIKEICKAMIERKPLKGIMKEFIFFSLNTFMLFPILVNAEKGEYLEGFAARSIDKHYYYFGATDEISSKFIPIKKKDGSLYVGDADESLKLWSHFSQFEKDIFSHLALWRAIREKREGIYTVADIIKSHFDSNPSTFWNIHDLKNSSNPQECLANLAIANASHLNLASPINAYSALKEFAVQVQICPSGQEILVNKAPDNLIKLLESFHLPYFVPQDCFVPENLNELMSVGVTRRCSSDIGFDIEFQLFRKDSSETFGLIECKNKEEAASRSSILEYVFKATNKKCPLTIQLCRKVGPSLLTARSFNEFEEVIPEKSNSDTKTVSADSVQEQKIEDHTSPEAAEDPKVVKKAKVAKVKLNFEQMLVNARQKKTIEPDNLFAMNIYSITADQDQLKFNTLYECGSSPDGVFVVVESNCTLSPKSFIVIAEKYRKEIQETSKYLS